MENITSMKSQILKLSFIISLLVLTPLLSTSLRTTYLYFLFNLLIVALGAEAGLLSFFSQAAQEKKPSLESFLTPKIPPTASIKDSVSIHEINVLEKCSSTKIVTAVKVHVSKKCPSTPSLFFIGGCDNENEAIATEEEMSVTEEYYHEEEVLPSGQELFHKAETFIGNFYKQLKIHGKTFMAFNSKIHGKTFKLFKDMNTCFNSHALFKPKM